MKIHFKDYQTAGNIQENGLYLFNIYIVPKHKEPERFTNIVQCMHCYRYEHQKQLLDEEKRPKLCSERGSSTHNYRDCESETKRYVKNKGREH